MGFVLLILCQPVVAQESQTYKGLVGKSPAEFTLSWQGAGQVRGSYFHPSGKPIVYQLEGSNPSEGILAFKEYTNGKETASVALTKSTQNGKIVWSGIMQNTDGRKLPIVFSRTAQSQSPVATRQYPIPDTGGKMPEDSLSPAVLPFSPVVPPAATPPISQGESVPRILSGPPGQPPANLAVTGERLALVIGNAAYPGAAKLDNPSRDAELVATSLETTGFKVFRGSNQSKAEMAATLKMFGQLLTDKSTALFYYAGHGIQWENANYLLAVDITEGFGDGVLADHALPMTDVVKMLGERRTFCNIIILDCCRNNPFATSMPQAKKGLAELKAPRETFISYATGLDEVALDGSGANSPFSEALAKEILKPNLKLDDVFKNVAAEVGKATANKQLPWRQANGVRDFYFIKTKDADNPFRVKKAVWNQGELSFTLENLVIGEGSNASATIRVKNLSKKSVWKIALDANCGQGFQPTVYYGGKLEIGNGGALSCLGARGIYTKVFLVGVWDSDRFMQEQSSGYDPSLVQRWFGEMNSLEPGEETLVTLLYRLEPGTESSAPNLSGKLLVRGQFYGAPETGGKMGKLIKFKPYFEEVIPNHAPAGGGTLTPATP